MDLGQISKRLNSPHWTQLSTCLLKLNIKVVYELKPKLLGCNGLPRETCVKIFRSFISASLIYVWLCKNIYTKFFYLKFHLVAPGAMGCTNLYSVKLKTPGFGSTLGLRISFYRGLILSVTLERDKS